MKLSLRLPSGKALDAEVQDSGAPPAHAWFERLRAPAAALSPGRSAEVALDWAVLRLEDRGGELQLLEPDYAGANLERFVPGVAATDRVFGAQQRLTQGLHLAPQPVGAAQYVRVAESALNHVSVFGHRQAETAPEFSGWQIVGVGAAEDSPFGQYSVRELAQLRLAWMVALCLPVGWSFRFTGQTLIDCAAPDGSTHAVVLSIDV